MRASLFLVTFAIALVGCEGETCREKRASFACDEGYTLACDALESTDDPVCRCEGDFALADDGACRARDIDGCCACLLTSDAGTTCTSGTRDACTTELASGASIAVDDTCRTSRCREVCWFLKSVDGGV